MFKAKQTWFYIPRVHRMKRSWKKAAILKSIEMRCESVQCCVISGLHSCMWKRTFKVELQAYRKSLPQSWAASISGRLWNRVQVTGLHVHAWVLSTRSIYHHVFDTMEYLHCRQTGAYAQILWRILAHDFIQFTIVFTVILLAFSGSFILALRGEHSLTTHAETRLVGRHLTHSPCGIADVIKLLSFFFYKNNNNKEVSSAPRPSSRTDCIPTCGPWRRPRGRGPTFWSVTDIISMVPLELIWKTHYDFDWHNITVK